MIRVIALLDKETGKNIKVREDHMSEKFPSKLLEVDRKKGGGDAGVWILQGMDKKWSQLRKRLIKQPRNSKKTDGKAMDKEK